MIGVIQRGHVTTRSLRGDRRQRTVSEQDSLRGTWPDPVALRVEGEATSPRTRLQGNRRSPGALERTGPAQP